jgi:hypothetical protein
MFWWRKEKPAVPRTRNTCQGPLLLNESFHEPLRCIFVAIPKTGSTSIREQLKQDGEYLIPNPHLTVLQVRDCIYPYYLRQTLGKNRIFPTQGVATDSSVREQARRAFASFFKFAMVRNPWVRAVSLYFRREGEPPSRKMDFERFCEQHFYASDTCVHPTLLQHQLDWLVDESGCCVMDYVGKLESMNEAIREIADRTDGRIRLSLQHNNRNPESLAASHRELYSARSRKIILQRFEKDIEYFKYQF